VSRKICYAFDTPFAGIGGHGEMEFPDGTTDEEIDEAVKEEFFNRYNYGWREIEQANSHGAGVSND